MIQIQVHDLSHRKQLVLKVASSIPKKMMGKERDSAAIMNCIGDFWKFGQVFLGNGRGDVLLSFPRIFKKRRVRVRGEIAKEALGVVVADGIVDPERVMHLFEALVA